MIAWLQWTWFRWRNHRAERDLNPWGHVQNDDGKWVKRW